MYTSIMDKKEMLKLRLDGLPYAEIAKRSSLSRQRVQQLLSPPKPIKDYVLRKYHGCCKECGLRVGRSGHIHHITSNGENYNDIENLELLCISCHRRKHADSSIFDEDGKLVGSERDTIILPVRIKKNLISRVDEKVKPKGISRNSWVIKCINEGLRSHTKRAKEIMGVIKK